MKFYSETLDRLFESEKALVEAEQAAIKAAQEKEAAAKAKKAEATKVEAAFKARNAARLAYNKNVSALRQSYAEDLKKLRQAFDEAVVAENKELKAAEEAYDAALKEFIAKHPEGYHMTLKDGDNVITLHSDNQTTDFTNALKAFDLMDLLFKI